MADTKANYAKAHKCITSEEVKTLETLLSKLRDEIGADFCIIPQFLKQGYFIEVYDNNSFLVREKHVVPDIKTFLQARQNGK
jgi:hypothetical protein